MYLLGSQSSKSKSSESRAYKKQKLKVCWICSLLLQSSIHLLATVGDWPFSMANFHSLSQPKRTMGEIHSCIHLMRRTASTKAGPRTWNHGLLNLQHDLLQQELSFQGLSPSLTKTNFFNLLSLTPDPAPATMNDCLQC